MAKPNDKLPLQFFVQRAEPSVHSATVLAESSHDETALSEQLALRLQSVYRLLWTVLSEFASRPRPTWRQLELTRKYWSEGQAVVGHPDVFLRCQLVEDRSLALILEQSIHEPSFSGRAGLIVGRRGTGKTALLDHFLAKSTIELELTKSTREYRVHSSVFQSHSDDFLARLLSRQNEVALIQDWFEETERMITVPDRSLKATIDWLEEVNVDLAIEREASRKAAAAHEESFMRMLALLANPKVGA